MDVDVDLIHTGSSQELEDVLDDGLARDRGHELGDYPRKREEPRALASRQNHRFHKETRLSIEKVS